MDNEAAATKTKEMKKSKSKNKHSRAKRGEKKEKKHHSLSMKTCSLHGLLRFPALASAHRFRIVAHLSSDQ